MKLCLVRHGDAVHETADPLRPLSSQGWAEVRKTADFLKSRKYSMKLFFHSTKLRARQTAEILKDALCPEGMLVEKKYLAPNDAIDQILCDIQNADQDTLIVGHMPFLSYLVSHLTDGDAVAFPTGGLAVLAKQGLRWMILVRYDPEKR